MMDVKIQFFLENFLKGRELLQNKGIRYKAWDEYERSSKVLPKTGKKLFDPNSSWLQHKQIEKGLQLRKDLLDMERIERKSQLAIAEWLPHEKKVRVLKKSGQEWANFGLEVNGALYLMPEEALLLLEMNCIELSWDGVAITLEQAYNILLDSDTSECTLEEYKVYSQFLRCGYRLQRCCGMNLLPKRTIVRESMNKRKKIIILPLNGLRMSNDCSRGSKNIEIAGNKKCSNKPSYALENRNLEEINIEEDDNDIGMNEDSVKKVLECIISDLESKERKTISDNKESHKLIQNNDSFKSERPERITCISPENLGNPSVIKKNYNSKVEIISEETVSQSVKILKDISRDNDNIENSVSKRLGTPIKHNVKVLSKRVDQVPMSIIVPEFSQIAVNENANEMKKKRNSLLSSSACSVSKKQRQEIIELSDDDDEVEEVLTSLTRMKLLNQLPNIASQAFKIKQRTLKGYIPLNIELRRDVYHYERGKWPCLQRADNSNRLFSKSTQNSQYSDLSSTPPNQRFDLSSNYSYVKKAQMHISQKYNRRTTLQDNLFSEFQYCRWNFYNQNSYLQQNSYLEFHHTRKHAWLQSKHFQAYNYNSVLLELMGNVLRSYIVRNQVPPNLQSIPSFFTWQNSCIEGRHSSNLKKSFNRPVQDKSFSNKGDFNSGKGIPTYTKDQGPSTWSELRTKWQEECTITINDEDLQEAETEKYNEIELVKQHIKPLIIIKRNTRLSEVSDKLKLLKKSAGKSQRQKEWDYNISYNVYSGSSHYKKTNPGSPMCRLLIIRGDEDHLNPLEVRRLPLNETDAPLVIAYVSKTSISYIQLGTVSVPDAN